MDMQTFSIQGLALITPPRFEDHRGFFEPVYNASAFRANGLPSEFCRLNRSFSKQRGTLRGMHHQLPPYQEAKLVRVLRGAVWDVCLDIRRTEPTYGEHVGFELSAENRLMALLPAGCAHGFLTLTDDVEVEYLCSSGYHPSHERSLRWDEPRFGIRWPQHPVCLSDKDRDAPPYVESLHWNNDAAGI